VNETTNVCASAWKRFGDAKSTTSFLFLVASLTLGVNNANASETNTTIETQSCPANFNDVKIPSDGKFCQVFAANYPASMVLHVPQSPSSVVDFYANEYDIIKEVKSRTFMQTQDKNTTLIISTDGEGTQVDILVKRL